MHKFLENCLHKGDIDEAYVRINLLVLVKVSVFDSVSHYSQ